ncbi:hypothetical protein [Prevotella sp. AGR2160]|uniref:hypothetical protein n=1 Tax=Prevotella sp. AGR2160 TaxID=1280674 RepID=UPI00048A5A44|nr:hypothetical protein [Prevotella sp. AGR2160]
MIYKLISPNDGSSFRLVHANDKKQKFLVYHRALLMVNRFLAGIGYAVPDRIFDPERYLFELLVSASHIPLTLWSKVDYILVDDFTHKYSIVFTSNFD